MSRIFCVRQLFLLALITVTIAGCGSSSISAATAEPGSLAKAEPANRAFLPANPPADPAAWPTAPPLDARQPWEELDAQGHVIPPVHGLPASKTGTIITAQSRFAAGVEWHSTSAAGVVEYYDAARLSSGPPDGNGLSWAVYRLPLGGIQPGVVSCDANLQPREDGSPSCYWIGVADYGQNRWEWFGPVNDHHVRIGTAEKVLAGAEYLSELGNMFVCIAAFDGARIDVVAVAANRISDGFFLTPPPPQNLIATAAAGALELTWDAVPDSDLAGYRIYRCPVSFSSTGDAGVTALPLLTGRARCLLRTAEPVWVGVTAIDIAGNESALSSVIHAAPLAGRVPELIVSASQPSGLIHTEIFLTAAGADYYDWDLDGDGLFEITGDSTGTQPAYTGQLGILRAAVAGATAGGGLAGGGVSLLLGTNSRPAASATANPQSGPVPLTVAFQGEAADVEDPLQDLILAWDFDGDGIYEPNTNTLTPLERLYDVPGAFNVKFRVMDEQGAWDIDTVTVIAEDPANAAPSVGLHISQGIGVTPLEVEFEALATDPEDEPLLYFWDFEGDGMYEFQSPNSTATHIYNETLAVIANVKVIDPHGAAGTAWTLIVANKPPDAVLIADPTEGAKGVSVFCDASATTDLEGIDNYEWDLDDDDVFNEPGAEADAEGNSSVVVVYFVPGQYTVTVKATDGYNAMPGTSLASVDVLVHGWVDVPVALAGGDHSTVPLALVGDHPALAYWNSAARDLCYARSATPTGDSASDWVKVTVDSTGEVGSDASLAVVAGRPAISYYDADHADLKYARATTITGTGAGDWTQLVSVDGADDVGRSTSLAVIDGGPAISYRDDTNTALKYARATSATGASASDWTQFVIVDTAINVGHYSSLAVVDGRPAISYYDMGNTALKYALSSTADGSAPGDWSTVLTIDNSATTGAYTSLRLVGGHPAIAYCDQSTHAVKYARAVTADGGTLADWSQLVTVASHANDPSFTSLALVGGLPAIAYSVAPAHALYFARAVTPTGGGAADWSDQQLIGSGEQNVSLAAVDGKPAIAYYQYVTEYEVHYAILY